MTSQPRFYNDDNTPVFQCTRCKCFVSSVNTAGECEQCAGRERKRPRDWGAWESDDVLLGRVIKPKRGRR